MNKRFLPTERSEWLVIYTRSKYEKKVDQLLKQQNIESYCPSVRTRRKWADRMKEVELPLFNSYVFVKINNQEQSKVLQTTGVINFINFSNKPAVVPSTDIEKIQKYVSQYSDIESVSLRNLNIGDQVTFNDGIFFDQHGEVLEVQGKRVLIVIKQLDCALMAKIKTDPSSITMRNSTNYQTLAIQ
ncbi:UpxY family transcription antiterminator [Pararcticibacter amylolyticus]|uniref:Antitermination protein NusG n=1 Tax=Pararcticibacter amylolyticus TaxID=2173175 RepID=A0A2U2PBW4_9SPHI|nr:UpxY family transcription antiterminator [Pararcticibacter amylolyticus]PWG78891.1 antitermination protein NusG [Pararcticibacter amylolyticus]